jgi:photosystem II stability/assembly factor-like uncharacterized protein
LALNHFSYLSALKIKPTFMKPLNLQIWLVFGLLLTFSFAGTTTLAQRNKKKSEAADTLKSSDLSGLKWRNIGPAFTSGRISDFAVNPNNHSEYYVAVSSGHIWKTNNNGTTFNPIFDNYGVYAIGCLAMDPNNSNVVWAGTGENNHQRALGYGNGVYKTEDGGKSWKNMGLKDSRQIGMIQVDPRNSNVVYVAAEGSVWGPGGERGLYKTEDGGKSWKKILDISENTGVNNVLLHPENPDIIFATSEQRRRHFFTKIGGGPETAVYRSTDAGKSFDKITKGLPSAHMGGMGIAIPQGNPDIVYLIIEAADDQGGFFRSTDRGASFEKMNKYSSSGQYYNELVCDPNNPDVVYSMDTYTKVTRDGGKTWDNVSLNERHVDDHAMWVDPGDSNHWMIGGDGGIYETFDNGTHYIHKTNLPVTQFYRVNVDNTEPFYWVYGGTQDNNSLGGPSQNTSRNGVSSCEWIVTLGGDGFWQAIEEGNPHIVYSSYQYGNIFRYDKKSGEKVKIKPEPRKNELHYRWNWDTPFFLSKHHKTTLYMAANKVFKSDDRGNSWHVISEDLTRNEDRNQFPVMGKYWPSNAVAKDLSTSQWGTIVSLAESPLKAGLLYAGTDDGLIQVSEDDGNSWTKISSFPSVPEYAYVSDLLPSKFDENIVFATFSNLKNDDFKAYVLKSSDKGKSWTNISANLPDETVYSIEQDFINPDLLFAGTEFSFFVSVDGGKTWTELGNGLPDIAIKDIAIQQREHDLAIATFGRGFYILDNYSPLREITPEKLKETEAQIFPVKDALMFMYKTGHNGSGSTFYTAKNPEFGATFTYYLKDIPKTKKQERLDKEKELFKEGKPITQPTQELLREEEEQQPPYLIFTIRDAEGNAVRRLFEKPSKGLNRVNWDLRYEMPRAQDDDDAKFNPTANNHSGYFALPGEYSVDLAMAFNNEIKPLAGPVSFEAITLNNKTLPVSNPEKLDQFYADLTEIRKTYDATSRYFNTINNRNENIRQVLHMMAEPQTALEKQTRELASQLNDISFVMNGTSPQASIEEVPPEPVSLRYRLGAILSGTWSHSGDPTQTMIMNYNILKEELAPVIDQLNQIDNKLISIENQLDELGAPYTPGRKPKLK